MLGTMSITIQTSMHGCFTIFMHFGTSDQLLKLLGKKHIYFTEFYVKKKGRLKEYHFSIA